MDGKPTPPVSSSGPKDKRLVPLPNGNSLSSPASSSPSNARPSQGKLVFGSNVYRTKETGKVILMPFATISISGANCGLISKSSVFTF